MGMFWKSLFTPQERVALLFVAGLGLAGLAVQQCGALFSSQPPALAPLQIRINSATPEQLAALPGIGPVMSKRIVEDRKLHGSFLAPSDLKRVKGLTRKAADKIGPHLRFD